MVRTAFAFKSVAACDMASKTLGRMALLFLIAAALFTKKFVPQKA